jgi:hypothetical protein
MASRGRSRSSSSSSQRPGPPWLHVLQGWKLAEIRSRLCDASWKGSISSWAAGGLARLQGRIRCPALMTNDVVSVFRRRAPGRYRVPSVVFEGVLRAFGCSRPRGWAASWAGCLLMWAQAKKKVGGGRTFSRPTVWDTLGVHGPAASFSTTNTPCLDKGGFRALR